MLRITERQKLYVKSIRDARYHRSRRGSSSPHVVFHAGQSSVIRNRNIKLMTPPSGLLLENHSTAPAPNGANFDTKTQSVSMWNRSFEGQHWKSTWELSTNSKFSTRTSSTFSNFSRQLSSLVLQRTCKSESQNERKRTASLTRRSLRNLQKVNGWL